MQTLIGTGRNRYDSRKEAFTVNGLGFSADYVEIDDGNQRSCCATIVKSRLEYNRSGTLDKSYSKGGEAMSVNHLDESSSSYWDRAKIDTTKRKQMTEGGRKIHSRP